MDQTNPQTSPPLLSSARQPGETMDEESGHLELEEIPTKAASQPSRPATETRDTKGRKRATWLAVIGVLAAIIVIATVVSLTALLPTKDEDGVNLKKTTEPNGKFT